MKWTKNWGTVTGPELYMLNRAEHTRKRMTKKKSTKRKEK